MSLYNELPKRGYEVRIWPALFPSDEQIMAYGGKLAPFILEHPNFIKGSTTDPKRFSNEDLQERLLSYGKAGFALQFMLDTSLSDADKYPLKFSDLMIMSVPFQKGPVELVHTLDKDYGLNELPNLGLAGDRFYQPFYTSKELLGYQMRAMSIDPSGRGKDETAYAVGYMLNGNVFVPEAGGLTGGYGPEVLESLAKIAKKHQVNTIVIEDNFGDGMFEALLKPVLSRIHPCETIGVRQHMQKEKRIIDTLEPVLMQHRLIVDPRVVVSDYETSKVNPAYSLFYQLSRITAERGALGHDDRLDALAILVKYFQDMMEQDSQGAEEDRRKELLLNELQDFIDHAQGGTGQDIYRNTWFSTSLKPTWE